MSSRKRLALAWAGVGDREVSHVVDGLLFGRYGVGGYLRLAEHRIRTRPDLAARALRRAAARYAAVRALGFRQRDYEHRIRGVAARLSIEVTA